MNDNGGTGGVRVFNAGMHGQKGTPWLGGTRASSFWRWPGTLEPHAVGALTAHIDVFPTMAQLAGAKLPAAAQQQLEGRSLEPLLRDAAAPWPERVLFTHVGRWPKGEAPEKYKYAKCSVRTPQWHLVSPEDKSPKGWQLYDVVADPGEQHDVLTKHAEVVKKMEAAYDEWWNSVQPQLVNENTPLAEENPYKTLYRKQFGTVPEVKPAGQEK